MYEVRGDVDQRAVEQLARCAESGDALGAALCADGHVGYSQPIGGVVAYRDQISPSGVGYDIGCGNKAVKTNLWVPSMRGKANDIASQWGFESSRRHSGSRGPTGRGVALKTRSGAGSTPAASTLEGVRPDEERAC